jgi:hypothetical protein
LILLALGLLLEATRAAAPGDNGLKLEDFEAGYQAQRWTFSNGAEFPGAQGGFSRTEAAAHSGRFGGELRFDFSGGGRYVSALLRMPERGAAASGEWNGVRLWLHRPEGHELQFRYTDATGQTFQKPVECPAAQWVEVTIPFGQWVSHWGGAEDGKPQPPPRTLALVLDHGQQPSGVLWFDDLHLVHHEARTARVAYPAYRFDPAEGWHLRSEGPRGSSRLEGKRLTLDFSEGARSISLAVPDRVLLGNVDRIRVRVRGQAKGHPVRLVMRTHFMTFHKIIGQWEGEGEQELATEGPPGPGWEWHGGENDGKIHGPLRLAEIQVDGGGRTDLVRLELGEVVVEVSAPEEKRCVLVGEARREENNLRFTAQMRALSHTPMPGRLHWTVRDWDGAQVGQGTAAVTVPPLCEVAEFRLPVASQTIGDRKFLEAEFRLEIPGQDVPPVLPAWVAPLEETGDAALKPESPFGMGVYLNRYGGDAAGLALMERAANLARDAGVKWSREDFSWNRLEPRRGEFNWTFHDHLVACAKRNGITVYAIVGYWSGWTKPYTAEGIRDYVQFARALVRRYGNDIKQWEIWNEPNIFFWQGPKDLYADLLKQSYAAIKELDPDAQVLGLSTAGIDTKYIARMLELEAPFDILTIHPYRRQLNDQGFIRDLKAVSDQVRLPDGRRRPVWLTEMGWATHTPHNTVKQDFAPNSLRTQAELIVRSYLCAIVSGVEPRTFWYNFRNDGDDPIYFEHQMGILYQDFRPKPAYRAYATLTRMLDGLKPEAQLPTADGVFAWRFQSSRVPLVQVVAVWSPLRDAQIELPVNSQRVVRVNAMGERTPLSATAGKVTVPLRKGAPVYLLEQPPR